MDCLHPVTVRNRGKGPQIIEVPCGKCANCLTTKLNQWVFRLQQHVRDFKYVSFVTLTYNDENLNYSYVDDDCKVFIYRADALPFSIDPFDLVPCLYKKDLQDFFRKLRKLGSFYGYKKNFINYYAIGEYGTDYNRPHYHILLFSNDMDFSKPINLSNLSFCWDKGFIDVKDVTEFRINYVAKHHLKPKNSKWFAVPQFTLRSNGLGLSFLEKDVADWFDMNKPTSLFIRDGVKLGVPRYFRTKLMEMYGYDISGAYKQRKNALQRFVDDKRISNERFERIKDIRAEHERQLDNRNFKKSKTKKS